MCFANQFFDQVLEETIERPRLSESFNLLNWTFADPEIRDVFSFESTFRKWVEVEIAIVEGQEHLGNLDPAVAESVRSLRFISPDDLESFRAAAANVGYPIIELVAVMTAALPQEHRGYIHLGATTQDIMDSALALQIVEVGAILTERLILVGDLLSDLVVRHAGTLMAGRTHAQNSVPITFGTKCAVYLSEFTRHLGRIKQASKEASCLSLFGASGTSSAFAGDSDALSEYVADRLGLQKIDVPWHSSRDRLANLALMCAMASASLARLAREVIDLSRTEIAELSESSEHHRGASSTMPQKRNPIASEGVLGLALAAIGSAAMMLRASEVGHERAAGEWQLEWKVLPDALGSTATALLYAQALLKGLVVNEDAMARNLEGDYGLILSEEYMVVLARSLGRERAHNIVYQAAGISRDQRIPLHEALLAIDSSIREHFESWPLVASEGIGKSAWICEQARSQWDEVRTEVKPSKKHTSSA